MADRKTGLEDLDLKSTLAKRTDEEGIDLGDLDQGRIVSTGVGLKQGELAAIKTIGAQVGALIEGEPVANNSIMRFALRRFIESYRVGGITAEEIAKHYEKPQRPKPKLRL